MTFLMLFSRIIKDKKGTDAWFLEKVSVKSKAGTFTVPVKKWFSYKKKLSYDVSPKCKYDNDILDYT